MTGAGAESDAPPVDPFGAPLSALRGVGPARAKALASRGLETTHDLLLLAPTRYAAPPPMGVARGLVLGADASLAGTVVASRETRMRNGRSAAEIRFDVEGAIVRATYFNRGWLAARAPKGAFVLAWGRATAVAPPALAGAGLRVLDGPSSLESALAALEPVHPAVPGVAEGTLRRLVREALAATSGAEDPLPEAVRSRHGLPTLSDALRRVHEPASREDAAQAGARLLFDRLLSIALAAAAAGRAEAAPAPSLPATPRIRERILARMPFSLTEWQIAALDEILADLSRPVAMRRLLLGDVGSGKTAVAAGALLACVAAKAQGLFVAPTEALAAQHARTLASWLAGSRVTVGLLSAATPAAERARVRKAAASGALDLLVGTHAVLAEATELPRLALAVVDEQHRFGVRQRLRARDMAERPHLLALSATPIPRSLALCLYGDLKVTRIAGRPAGRAAPEAVVATASTAFGALREAVRRGERAFVVYPAIRSESAPALEREGRALRRAGGPLAGLAVAWLHGGLPVAERTAALDSFRTGEAEVLVATTIVEVGVDVPEATVMVVVGADRLGLATLHQLRGRVGRGLRPGRVYLVQGGGPDDASKPSAASAARLRLLEKETDGFALAEADLLARGPGDLCGVRQHGRGGALPLAEGRDRGFLESAAETARLFLDGGVAYGAGYFARLAASFRSGGFDPPDAV